MSQKENSGEHQEITTAEKEITKVSCNPKQKLNASEIKGAKHTEKNKAWIINAKQHSDNCVRTNKQQILNLYYT